MNYTALTIEFQELTIRIQLRIIQFHIEPYTYDSGSLVFPCAAILIRITIKSSMGPGKASTGDTTYNTTNTSSNTFII